jgi:hypothetical protein
MNSQSTSTPYCGKRTIGTVRDYLVKSMILAVIAFVLALVASVALLVIPFYSGTGSGVSLECDAAGVCREVVRVPEVIDSQTLLEVNGPRILVILTIPVLITGAALAAGWTRRARMLRIIATGVLFAGALLSMFSIGVFYIPSLIALALSVIVTPGPKSDMRQETNVEQPI